MKTTQTDTVTRQPLRTDEVTPWEGDFLLDGEHLEPVSCYVEE